MKIASKLTFGVLSLFLLTFLVLALWELRTQLFSTILLIIVLIFFIYGLVDLFSKLTEIQFNIRIDLITIFITALSALLTWVLNHNMNFKSVIASSIVGLIGYFVTRLLKREDFGNLSVPIYCGSFVGMSSTLVLFSWEIALFSGILCGILLVLMRGIYKGVGGKLGAMACLSVSITLIIINLVNILIL